MAIFLAPGYLVRIVCYDGDKQVARLVEVTAFEQGLLEVEDAAGRSTVYNLRSPGVLSVSEVFPEDEGVADFGRARGAHGVPARRPERKS